MFIICLWGVWVQCRGGEGLGGDSVGLLCWMLQESAPGARFEELVAAFEGFEVTSTPGSGIMYLTKSVHSGDCTVEVDIQNRIPVRD